MNLQCKTIGCYDSNVVGLPTVEKLLINLIGLLSFDLHEQHSQNYNYSALFNFNQNLCCHSFDKLERKHSSKSQKHLISIELSLVSNQLFEEKLCSIDIPV